jgi:mycothiol synthase
VVTTIPLVRAVTADDADDIFELMTVCDIATVGEPDSTIVEVSADLANHNLVAAAVDDPRGGLLGYVWVEHSPTNSLVWGDVLVRPGTDPAIGRVLLDWLRETARAVGGDRAVHVFAYSTDLAKQQLYEAAGGAVIRRSYRMFIDFDDTTPPVVPPLSDGVVISPIKDTEADLQAMHRVIDTAFLDHFAHETEPYDEWLQHSVRGPYPDLSLWWLATVDGAPAAGLYAGVLPTGGYVDTLGTLRDYRGKGLARSLLLTSFAEFYRRGQRRVSLGVDAANPTGALALYESVGMTAEHESWRYELPSL